MKCLFILILLLIYIYIYIYTHTNMYYISYTGANPVLRERLRKYVPETKREVAYTWLAVESDPTCISSTLLFKSSSSSFYLFHITHIFSLSAHMSYKTTSYQISKFKCLPPEHLPTFSCYLCFNSYSLVS